MLEYICIHMIRMYIYVLVQLMHSKVPKKWMIIIAKARLMSICIDLTGSKLLITSVKKLSDFSFLEELAAFYPRFTVVFQGSSVPVKS